MTTVTFKRNLVALALIVSLIFAGLIAFSPASNGATTTATKHYIANVTGSYSQVAALGYNVLDVSSVSNLSSLPAGTQAMFWLGTGQKCPQPADSGFQTSVNNLIPHASKIYGVYLSDEPQTPGESCPVSGQDSTKGPANIKARSDYVKSKLPNAKTFIVIDNQASFSPYRPAVTGVHLVGVDPYPCNVNNATSGCERGKIAERVGWATTGGWPKSSIVPTFQLFGQQCTTSGDKYYRFPSDAELHTMLGEWQAAGPFSELDYSYGWNHQLSSSCPTLVDRPSAQQIMKEYFATGNTPAPTTTTGTPTTTTTSATPSTTTTTAVPTQTVTRTVTSTVTQTVTQPPVTQTVTVTPSVNVTELSCALAPTQPSPGNNVTCTYK